MIERWTALDAFPEPRLIRVRHPVVLMHGFGALASIRRGGMLHPIALALRKRVVWAYAPNVPPYQTVALRTQAWKGRLAHVLRETGAPQVHLIAHSMGGLDARHYITHADGASHVASLTTIATPHRGTSLAVKILEQPSLVRSSLTEAANWLGNRALEEMEADFLSAIRELTPTHLEDAFNPDTPDHPSVRYWSYAAAAGKGTEVRINPVLRYFNGHIYKAEGPNDGFVSVNSAQWTNTLGTLPADHAQQLGIGFLGSNGFDAAAFYASHVEMLAAQGL